ncbi:RimK/LysX family protein [Reinekea marina]|uniref:ATP-dependent zinc protease n=1 Tax=Reinekea marina TaxID=1310421 RepID=A0ABV7WRL2_9GAMM|nr:RimK/LysX family protein [Reinekea marina]MDN3650859.1 RimK/LysX family protein [Reinekea marina]
MTLQKFMVGSIENCDLPGLGIIDLEVRVDTGAKTSSLHVDHIKKFKKGGKKWVSFDIHPTVHNVDEVITCQAPLRDVRKIKSSNGVTEERYIVRTSIRMNQQEWQIDISLTDRSDMSYLMLLGREAMLNRITVDPSETFLLTSE